MFFVGGPRHGHAFVTHARPRIVRMAPGDHPEVADPGEVTTPDPETFVDIVSAAHYRRVAVGISLPHVLTGKPAGVAHRIHVYVHEAIVPAWGTPSAMGALQDATLQWVLRTFGEEVTNPLVAQQNGHRPHDTDKETPAP